MNKPKEYHGDFSSHGNIFKRDDNLLRDLWLCESYDDPLIVQRQRFLSIGRNLRVDETVLSHAHDDMT